MNSIRRPRLRPRDESVSFRTLWWLLPREAYIRMLEHPDRSPALELAMRRWLLTCSTSWVQTWARNWLRRHPSWRIRP